MLNKNGQTDYLYYALHHFLSEFPDGWDGEQVMDYIEENCLENNTLLSDNKITFWSPLESSDAEAFFEATYNLASQFEAFHNGKDPYDN